MLANKKRSQDELVLTNNQFKSTELSLELTSKSLTVLFVCYKTFNMVLMFVLFFDIINGQLFVRNKVREISIAT